MSNVLFSPSTFPLNIHFMVQLFEKENFNCLAYMFISVHKLETGIRKKNCLYSQCSPVVSEGRYFVFIGLWLSVTSPSVVCSMREGTFW